MAKEFDLVVIGAGPGGYVAAIRLAQLGKKVCVVEREYLGGVCLNVGCIPSKAMISAAGFLHKTEHQAEEMGFSFNGRVKVDFSKLQSWKQTVCDRMSGGVKQLLKGNKVEVVMGEAKFETPNDLVVKTADGKSENLKAKNFIIATGSRPIEIPGFAFDEETVLSSTGGLAQDKALKSLLVIGGGYIGLEISGFMNKLGTDVTVVEATENILSGIVDKEVTQTLTRKLKTQGVKILYGTKAKSYKKTTSGVTVEVEKEGKTEKLDAEKILVTVGRKPNSDQMNLKDIGLAIDERGFLKVNEQMRTNISHIFAIGDIASQPMLAHKASHEGVLVAEVIAGQNRAFDAKTIPAVIFTDPEIASAGMTEEECKAKGYTDLKISKFPFAANGKAVSLMETDGFVKYIADAKTDVILGVHIIGPEASNLISEAVLAIEMGARLQDVALSIHPHPTLGETMMEAAEATLGHAIHIIQKPLRK